MPNRDVLNFITSGRMSSLRELSMAIDYKDWVRYLASANPLSTLRSYFMLTIFSTISYNGFPRSLTSVPLISHSLQTM